MIKFFLVDFDRTLSQLHLFDVLLRRIKDWADTLGKKAAYFEFFGVLTSEKSLDKIYEAMSSLGAPIDALIDQLMKELSENTEIMQHATQWRNFVLMEQAQGNKITIVTQNVFRSLIEKYCSTIVRLPPENVPEIIITPPAQDKKETYLELDAKFSADANTYVVVMDDNAENLIFQHNFKTTGLCCDDCSFMTIYSSCFPSGKRIALAELPERINKVEEMLTALLKKDYVELEGFGTAMTNFNELEPILDTAIKNGDIKAFKLLLSLPIVNLRSLNNYEYPELNRDNVNKVIQTRKEELQEQAKLSEVSTSSSSTIPPTPTAVVASTRGTPNTDAMGANGVFNASSASTSGNTTKTEPTVFNVKGSL